MIAPCKGCEERHAKCHADCSRYLSFKEEVKENKEAAHLYWLRYQNAHDTLARQAIKSKK